MNTVEFVVSYKSAPLEQQASAIFSNEIAANNFAFDVESNGGVSVITRRIKHIAHGERYTDAEDTDPRSRF